MKRLLTGLKPSGELTLGSYIGGIKQSVKYQDNYDSFMFVPDMHAITVEQDPKELHERIKSLKSFMYTEKFNSLEPAQRICMERQLGAMISYNSILEERISLVLSNVQCCNEADCACN